MTSLQFFLDWLSTSWDTLFLFWLLITVLIVLGKATYDVLQEEPARVRPSEPPSASPNEHIRRALHIALVTGLAYSLVSGMTGVLAIGLIAGRFYGFEHGISLGGVFGLVVGLAFGLGATLYYGGLAVIQHITVRLACVVNGHTPLRLVSFLDYAYYRVFVTKDGGSYRFVHRQLHEFFVTLFHHPPHIEELAKDIEKWQPNHHTESGNYRT